MTGILRAIGFCDTDNWQVANDYKPMMEAWNAGFPLVQSVPSSKAQQSIWGMADDLIRRLAPAERNRDRTMKRSLTKTTKIMRLSSDAARGDPDAREAKGPAGLIGD